MQRQGGLGEGEEGGCRHAVLSATADILLTMGDGAVLGRGFCEGVPISSRIKIRYFPSREGPVDLSLKKDTDDGPDGVGDPEEA